MLRSNIEAKLNAKRVALAKYQEEQSRIGDAMSKLRKELLFNASMADLVQYQIEELEEQLEEMKELENE